MSEEQKNQSNHSETPDEPSVMGRLRQRLVKAWMRPLPLQDETATFILVNVLDIFVTYLLLSIGGSEANPIARFFLYRWGFDGMIFFKMGIIAFFCVVTLLISQHDVVKARRLLRFGTVVVLCVVLYGVYLLIGQLI